MPFGTHPKRLVDPFGPERKFRHGLIMICPVAVGGGGGGGGAAHVATDAPETPV